MTSSFRIANAPCSWGLIGDADEAARRALDYTTVLDEMTRAGYVGTELGDLGFMPTDPKQLAAELERRGLTMLGAWVGVAFADEKEHAPGRARAIEVAKLLAAVAPAAFVVLADEDCKNDTRRAHAGRIRPEEALDDARFATFARGVDMVARAVHAETGLRSVFHHHGGGWIETPAEVDRLMAATDPTVVGLCLDTGHFAFGGGDPVAGYRKHAARIWHVHFKDCSGAVLEAIRAEDLDYRAAVKRGVYCELGHGVVAFDAMLAALREANYSGWIVVEQDVLPGMGAPFESAKRNRDFLRALGV